MTDERSPTCDEVEEHMADVLDGTASEELLDHIAECDRCRDARYDAEAARETAETAGADFVEPPDLEARILAAVDGAPAPERTTAPMPEPTAEREAAPEPEPEPERVPPPAPTLDEDDEDDEDDEEERRDGGDRPVTAAEAPVERAPKPTEPKPLERKHEPARVLQRRRLIVGGGIAALAAAAAVALSLGSSKKGGEEELASAPWKGRVAHVASAAGGEQGLERCGKDWADCSPVKAGEELAPGAWLRTNAQTRAQVEMGDGTTVTMDRSTKLVMTPDKNRTCRLSGGGVVAEVTKVEGQTARFELPKGHAEVLGTKFALRVDESSTTVDVSRGSVKLVDSEERAVTVRAGEEGRLFEGIPPYVTSAPALGQALAWSEQALGKADQGEEVVVRGLGELKAKKPGAKQELGAGAVTLTAHSVKVRIVDNIARTEIDETFTNTTDDVLEGIYRFPLPPDAQIERLALEVDGKLKEGAFVDRDRAAAIWRGAIVNAAPQLKKQVREEIVWVPGPWKDPALLEWQRGGRFELRIYPIPKKGSRRVVLSYTQVIQPTGGVRRYTYPLPHDPSGSTQVAKFDVDVQVKGHDPKLGVRAVGYDVQAKSAGAGAETLALSESNFVPTGDLTIEYGLPNRDEEVTVWAYQPSASDIEAIEKKRKTHEAKAKKAGGAKKQAAVVTDAESKPAKVRDDAPFVALALRPKLPRWTENTRRAYAIVVDSSRSMIGERYRRAAQLASRVVSEMDRGDVFTVMACDATCRSLPGGLQTPSAQTASEAKQFLDGLAPEGGSDVAAAITSAHKAARTAGDRVPRVIYIGDGTPTVGAIHHNFIQKEISQEMGIGSGSVTAVAIGADSDLRTLRAIATGGGGVVLPYVPGQRTLEAAYAILGATYGNALAGATVELPSGLTEVAPTNLDTIPAGGETIVVARMDRANTEGTITLRGKVGSKDFEQRYPVRIAASTSQGNAFVPRLYAAARIAELEKRLGTESKTEAIGLSTSFNVASRHTSLLVLESEAMFKAFGLDNRRGAPVWTGEEAADSTAAAGEIAFETDEDDDGLADAFGEESEAAGAGGLGLSGIGSGGASKKGGALRGGDFKAEDKSRRASKPRPKPKSAPAKRPSGSSGPFAPPPVAAQPEPSLDPAPRNQFDWERPREITRRPPRRPPWGGRRGFVPMRRVFERVGVIQAGTSAPKAASSDKIAAAERKRQDNPESRNALMDLYKLLSLAGDLERANALAERWSSKDPLDPEALTARADLAARSGDRDLAIRILGSVVDVRPGDFKSQWRLARLHRWAGAPELGCRFSMAIAQFKTTEAKLLVEAVRCLRETGQGRTADELLAAAPDKTRATAERLLKKKDTSRDEKLRGDLKLEATWDGNVHDLDISLVHPDGHRVSWLGAPTRSVITARDVKSTRTEGLALRGGKPGEYAIEISRVSGNQGRITGTLEVKAANTKKSIPFVLEGNRLVLGTVRISTREKLVPL